MYALILFLLIVPLGIADAADVIEWDVSPLGSETKQRCVALPNECPTTSEVADLLDKCPLSLADLNTGEEGLGGVEEEAAAVLSALGDVLSKRAREEARSWLVDTVLRELCEEDRSRRYLPNVCQLERLSNGTLMPFPIEAVAEGFRRDFRLIPSCLIYQHASRSEYKMLGYMVQAESWPTANRDIAKCLLRKPTTETTVTDDLPEDRVCRHRLYEHLRNLAPDVAGASGLTVSYPAVCPESDAQCAQLMMLLGELLDLDPSGSTSFVDYGALASQGLHALRCEAVDAPAICDHLASIASLAHASAIAVRPVKEGGDPQAVSKALDRAISPVGAWRIKQVRPTISLTGLVGLQGGQETVNTSREEITTASYGLFLPVGLEVTQPLWGHVGFLISAIDIGALASFSEGGAGEGGEVSSEAEVTWSSLVSPGAYLRLAFPRSPLTVGFGVSRTPKLRSVSVDGVEADSTSSTRVLGFIAIDVTLFQTSAPW